MSTNQITLQDIEAGRDATFSIVINDRDSLRARFRDQLQKIDESINSRLPGGGLRSPTADNTLQPFSSEELIMSLTRIGIPIQVGIEITENLQSFLEPLITTSEEVTTGHIRRAVLQTLYSFGDTQARQTVAHWADEYARRYGNPNERLKVLCRDGTEIDLSYAFLLDAFLPHFIQKILGIDYARLQDAKIISNETARRMADQILDHVRGLNVYAIRYKTLFNLAYDLAVQPPHPWFIDASTRETTIEYDLKRACWHCDQLDALLSSANKEPAKHALRETVNHASSALLAFYGAFLGLGQGGAGPLAQLIHTLSMSAENGNPVLWEYSSIKKIDGDLKAIGKSLPAFRIELTRLSHNLSGSDKLLNVGTREARALLDTAEKLIHPPDDPRLALSSDRLVVADRDRISAAIVQAFVRVPSLKQIKPSKRGFTRYMHQLPLPKLDPCLLIVPCCLVSREELLASFDQVVAEMESDQHCNSAIFILHVDDSADNIETVRRYSTRQRFFFALTTQDLLAIVNSSDRTQALIDRLFG